MEQFTDSPNEKMVQKRKKPMYKEMIYRLSVHGALDFYESHTFPMKLGWAIVILVALIFATIEIYLTVDTYLKSPILTTYAIVPKNELEFPNVYICPMNALDKEKLELNALAIRNLIPFFGMTKALAEGHVMLTKINKNYDAIQSIARGGHARTSVRPKSIMDTVRDVSMTKADFVNECAFHRKPVACENITSLIFDGDYGQCFLFSVDESQKVIE